MPRPPLPIRLLFAATLGVHALRKLGEFRREIRGRNAAADSGPTESGFTAPWNPRRRRAGF